MSIQHSVITDPDIHEPKGVSTASLGEVYVADGAGSGDWSPITLDSNTADYGAIYTADGVGSADFSQTCWQDLFGPIIVRDTGVTAPSLATFRAGQIEQYAFSAADKVGFTFHLPHNYKRGTDLYFHVHWSHNGTAISGNMTWTYHATYAKGHDQEIWPVEVSGVINRNTVNIATTPRYIHALDEIQLSTPGGSASLLDTDALEVDGIILLQLFATTIPTITGGAPNEPFLIMADMHYQADMFGTKNKAPNFYV
jgi:hypothetical protein